MSVFPAQSPAFPVWAQVVEACVAHSLSGSVPATMGPQTPLAPAPFLAAEHAWQRPGQAVPQQTPSTQNPDEQSLAMAQAPPLPVATAQTPPLQA